MNKIIGILTIAFTAYVIYNGYTFGFPQNVTLEQALLMKKLTFLDGLCHGYIIVVSFIASLFEGDVAFYALYNNGREYNMGFGIGVILVALLAKLNNRSQSEYEEE
jgi:hypothetical protein